MTCYLPWTSLETPALPYYIQCGPSAYRVDHGSACLHFSPCTASDGEWEGEKPFPVVVSEWSDEWKWAALYNQWKEEGREARLRNEGEKRKAWQRQSGSSGRREKLRRKEARGLGLLLSSVHPSL